ncbi:MAG: hypothetical protein ACJ8LL_07965 [Candidatus Udaeobacter sp.]
MRMSNVEGNPNIEARMISRIPRLVYSCFVIISSFVIRHASFA